MHFRYLKIFFLAAFLWIGIIATINFVVDPAAIYNVINREGFNTIKPKIGKYRFIWKTAYIEHNKPEIVFLGNSRVETGIDPDSLYQFGLIAKESSVFNAAIPAASVYGIKRFAQQAIYAGDARKLFIGIDYMQFRHSSMQDAQQLYLEHEGVFSVDAMGNTQLDHRWTVYSKTLFSIDALRASLQTLKKQKKKYVSLTRLGHNSNDDMVQNILASGSQKHYFLKEDIRFIDDYLKVNNSALVFNRGIEEFREILLLAREHHVKTTLFITPTHVHLQYLDAHLGNETPYYNWKRSLAKLVAEVNTDARQPVTVWDFSIPMDDTMETLPANDHEIMQWYLDPSHFRATLGDRMLRRLMDGSPAPGDENFGMVLSTETVEQGINQHRQQLLLWQEKYPDDYADFMRRIEQRRKLLGYKQ